jgi:hypothetical protein
VKLGKKCTSLKNSTALNIKPNTTSIQYFLRCQWLLSLSRYSPEFYGTYGTLEFMTISFNILLKHE